MTAKSGQKVTLLKAIISAAVGVTLCACNPIGARTANWTEDVALEDGTTLVIKRTVTFTESGALGGGAYNSTELASTMTFTGSLASLPMWSVPLEPMVLYRDRSKNGQWVIVATTTTCDIWNRRGEPKPPYWEFRLGALGWEEEPVSPTSFDRPANLFQDYTRLDELYDSHYVHPGETRASIEQAGEQYRNVSAQAHSNCTHATNLPTSANIK
jgi:hypothetical protein